MGRLSVNPMGPNPSGERPLGGESGSKGHRWLWIVALAIVIAVGFWYFRGSRTSTEAQGPGAPGGAAAGKGQGRQGAGAGGFQVPVGVASPQRGYLSVYFNGHGTVSAFNTVTDRSRVDGQITKINFTEGQFVHQGQDLVDIDSRPFQVQLEQAEGQLAKVQALLRGVQVNY